MYRKKALDMRLAHISQQNEDTVRLESIPGIGPLGASALTDSLGNSSDFQNGRHFASYLGLVPKEHSSGGKVRLLGITKRGDAYLRGLLSSTVLLINACHPNDVEPSTSSTISLTDHQTKCIPRQKIRLQRSIIAIKAYANRA